MSKGAERSSEFELIARWFAPLAAPGAFDLKDDAALFAPPARGALVFTHDTILENIHFLQGDPPDLIARKALRVNLSDLFAKGATPIGYTLSLGLPDHWRDADVESLAAGLKQDHEIYGLRLFGGDTYRSPERLCLGIAMTGQVAENSSYVSRLGASSGEIVAVTGTIGDAALGLDFCQRRLDLPGYGTWLEDRYRLPRPPAAFAPVLGRFATAAMDVSDGLLGDLAKLCGASGTAAVVQRENVPLSDAGAAAVKLEQSWWKRILTGGDDYQVLFTTAADDFEACRSAGSQVGVAVTALGETVDGPAGDVRLQDGAQPVDYGAGSYSHF